MNKMLSVNIEAPVGARALRILRGLPGVGAEHAQRGRLSVGGQTLPVAVESKARVDAAQAWRIVHRLEASPAPHLLVVAQESTKEARRILADHRIGVADGHGNAHVEFPGVLIHVETGRDGGRRPTPAGQPRLAGKAGVGAQALLLHPDRRWGVNDLAREAGISVGLAHRVLSRLEAERVLAAKGRGPRRARTVADPRALLDLWAEEAEDRRVVRTLVYVLARNPRELLDRLSGGLEEHGIRYAVTGAAAASLLAPFVTAVPLTELWLGAAVPPEEAAVAAGGEIVESGNNVVLLQAADDTPLAYARKVDGAWVANDFRIYRDLLRDPRRGREQAGRFREEVIRF